MGNCPSRRGSAGARRGNRWAGPVSLAHHQPRQRHTRQTLVFALPVAVACEDFSTLCHATERLAVLCCGLWDYGRIVDVRLLLRRAAHPCVVMVEAAQPAGMAGSGTAIPRLVEQHPAKPEGP